MGNHVFFGLLATTLIASTVSFLAYPLTAEAQQAENPQIFARRMSGRIDSLQMRIKSLENQLTGGSSKAASGEFETGGGLLGQLEQLDEECRELERAIDSMERRSSGPAGLAYDQQRQIEYYVWGLERRLQQIRKWMRAEEDEPESSVEPPPEIDTEEDGISDEDWAADWAKGDR